MTGTITFNQGFIAILLSKRAKRKINTTPSLNAEMKYQLGAKQVSGHRPWGRPRGIPKLKGMHVVYGPFEDLTTPSGSH